MSPDRYRARRSKLITTLKKAEVDALLVYHPPNVRYLTGFTGEATHLLIGPRRTLMISDSRFETQLKQECPELEATIRTAKIQQVDFLAQTINGLGISRIGFEAGSTSFADWEDLTQKVAKTALAGTKGLVEALRQTKDPDEIAAIREAIHIAERGYHFLRAEVLPEMTELQSAHDLEHAMRRFGALRAAFEPIVGVGPQSALPHYRGGPRRLDEAPFFLVDWGAVGPAGYHSDLTRVVATSKIPPKLEKLYRVVLSARQAALDRLRPGVPCQEVDAAARKTIEDAGFSKFFGHGLGHGIGLEIHEGPRLSPTAKDNLQAGMVITIEPGIYVPDFGGVRLEDDVLITRDGYEVLSTVPLEITMA